MDDRYEFDIVDYNEQEEEFSPFYQDVQKRVRGKLRNEEVSFSPKTKESEDYSPKSGSA